MTDNSNTLSVSAVWTDSSSNIQTSASNISYISSTPVLNFSTLSLLYKRFNTQGMLGYYTFSLSADIVIDSNSRFYFQFPYSIMSSFNYDKQI
jgi:hypothetical protein